MGQRSSKKALKPRNDQFALFHDEVVPSPLDEYAKLVVHEFISEIEKQFTRNVIIPDSIILLCLKFWQIEHLMYLIEAASHSREIGLYISSMDNDKNWKCNIYNLYSNQQQIDSDCWKPQNSLLHYKTDVVLPSKLANAVRLRNKYLLNNIYTKNKYDIIISSSRHYHRFKNSCIIIDKSQCDNIHDVISGYHYEFPENQILIQRPSASTFSYKYGLIEFSAVSNATYNDMTRKNKGSYLNIFNENDGWKSIPSMTNKYLNLTISVIEIDNKEKLIALGGSKENINGIMEIYDWNKEYWMKISNGSDIINKVYATCFDKKRIKLYADTGSKIIACYDFVKNGWYKLPERQFELTGTRTMVLWKKYDLLFSANSINNPIQYIDLRENVKWKVIKQPFNSLFKEYGATPRVILNDNGKNII